MKVTIEGDLEQVSAALSQSGAAPRTPRQERLAENAAKRQEFIERRQVVVDAFKKVRHGDDDETRQALLEAIRRPAGVTDADLGSSSSISSRVSICRGPFSR